MIDLSEISRVFDELACDATRKPSLMFWGDKVFTEQGEVTDEQERADIVRMVFGPDVDS